MSLSIPFFSNIQNENKEEAKNKLGCITRKFGKFLKKNNRDKTQPSNRYNTKKIVDFNSKNYNCFGCGKQGHIKAECENTVSKEKGAEIKYEKKGKGKIAYIA